MNEMNEYSGVKVLIMGLGLNGGGLASAVFLGKRGAEISVTDLRDEKTLAPSIEKLEQELKGKNANISYTLGKHDIADFEKADIVIKNPGVRPDSEYLQKAKRIETDISLFLSAFDSRLSAVTGTKGKSSVSSAIHWVLKEWHAAPENPEAGKRSAHLGGNITISPLNFLDKIKQQDDVVLELSSYQLGDLRGLINPKTGKALLKPRVAVLSAIMPDHLDRYGTMEAYIADKRVIYQGQDKNDITVTGDDEWGRSFREESKARSAVYSSTLSKEMALLVPEKLLVPGRHQNMNLFAAGLALLDLGLPQGFIQKSLGLFPGIEHRLEFFHEIKIGNGLVRFYNDSAATIPEAAAAACAAFENPPILVCGGTDKDLDFSVLAKAAAHVKDLILLAGSGSQKLKALLENSNIKYSGPFDSLEQVVHKALEKAQAGDVVVLSPGCASFEMFLNEFDRGNKWKAAVRKLAD